MYTNVLVFVLLVVVVGGLAVFLAERNRPKFFNPESYSGLGFEGIDGSNHDEEDDPSTQYYLCSSSPNSKDGPSFISTEVDRCGYSVTNMSFPILSANDLYGRDGRYARIEIAIEACWAGLRLGYVLYVGSQAKCFGEISYEILFEIPGGVGVREGTEFFKAETETPLFAYPENDVMAGAGLALANHIKENKDQIRWRSAAMDYVEVLAPCFFTCPSGALEDLIELTEADDSAAGTLEEVLEISSGK